MTTWGRLEILPDLLGLRRRWIAARARRRQEREWRIEWASRDAIFFAAIAAQASEAMIWVALFAIAACGNVLGSFIFGGLNQLPQARAGHSWTSLCSRWCRVRLYGYPVSTGVAGGSSTAQRSGGTAADGVG